MVGRGVELVGWALPTNRSGVSGEVPDLLVGNAHPTATHQERLDGLLGWVAACEASKAHWWASRAPHGSTHPTQVGMILMATRRNRQIEAAAKVFLQLPTAAKIAVVVVLI